MGSPAIGAVFGDGLPTYSPFGRVPAFAVDVPAPGELAVTFAFAPEEPGLPDAPACPSGVAAKVPRRLPLGGSGGPVTAGCKLSAMRLPREPAEAPLEAEPDTDGGGGTTWGEMAPVRLPPGAVLCAATGSCGAGAITLLGAMLISPSRRVDELSTAGGGAIKSGCRPGTAACVLPVCTSGGGATTELCRFGEARRRSRRSASGAGMTTELSTVGVKRRISAAGTRGESGMASCGFCRRFAQATTLGIATSCFSLTLGGATMVCERLSLSRGTEMIGCGDRSGSAFAAGADGAERVSRGGRYSDA